MMVKVQIWGESPLSSYKTTLKVKQHLMVKNYEKWDES